MRQYHECSVVCQPMATRFPVGLALNLHLQPSMLASTGLHLMLKTLLAVRK